MSRASSYATSLRASRPSRSLREVLKGATMETLDLRTQYKHLYKPSAKKVVLVDVPPLQFAMIDGVIPADQRVGDSPDFEEALSALYGISYTCLLYTSRCV